MLSKVTDLEHYLIENCLDKCIAIEYTCGDCSKMAAGYLDSVFPNFIRLVSKDDTCPYVMTTVVARNGLPLRETAKEIIIMKNNIISVEVEPYYGTRYGETKPDIDKNLLSRPIRKDQGENLQSDNLQSDNLQSDSLQSENQEELKLVQNYKETDHEYEAENTFEIEQDQEFLAPLQHQIFEFDEMDDLKFFEDLQEPEEEE